jgi:hypothetical protein
VPTFAPPPPPLPLPNIAGPGIAPVIVAPGPGFAGPIQPPGPPVPRWMVHVILLLGGSVVLMFLGSRRLRAPAGGYAGRKTPRKREKS